MHTEEPAPLGTIEEAIRGLPAPPLRGLIASYDGYRQRGIEPARHLGLPSPFMTVIVTLHEPLHVARHLDRRRPVGRYDSLVGGLHTSPVVIAHDGAQSGIQIRMSPLGARALLGLPAGELAGVDVAAEDVLGALARELHERLGAAATWRERFAILDSTLARRVMDAPDLPAPLVAAWRLLMASAGRAPVAAIAHEVGWSERHLANRFREEIGLAPKAAARVVRFHRARHLLQSQLAVDGSVDIAWAAASSGYYDQSHLVRDFRSFAGLAPSQWLSAEFRNVQAKAVPNHLLSDA